MKDYAIVTVAAAILIKDKDFKEKEAVEKALNLLKLARERCDKEWVVKPTPKPK